MPKYSLEIQPGSKVLIARSNFSSLDGERLNLLIHDLQILGCEITVLVADTLYCHIMSRDGALAEGKRFRSANKEALLPAQVYGWDEYKEAHKEEVESNLKEILRLSNFGTEFYKKMCKTHNSCKKSMSLETSIDFQREEYSVHLTFEDFDYCIAPEPVSAGILHLSFQFPERRLPQHVQVTFPELRKTNASSTFFLEIKPTDGVPFKFRRVFDALNDVLKSPEISDKAKRSCLDYIRIFLELYKWYQAALPSLLSTASSSMVRAPRIVLADTDEYDICGAIQNGLYDSKIPQEQKAAFCEQIEKIVLQEDAKFNNLDNNGAKKSASHHSLKVH